MSKVQILPGHEYDIVSPTELDAAFLRNQERMDAFIRDAVRGIKPFKFTARVDTSTTGIGLLVNPLVCPRSGYVWSILSASCFSAKGLDQAYLCKAANPSDIPLLAGTSGIPADTLRYVLDAFTVAIPVNTFSRGQILLEAGEFPAVIAWSSAVGGNSLLFRGTAVEVPAEMVGKLLI